MKSKVEKCSLLIDQVWLCVSLKFKEDKFNDITKILIYHVVVFVEFVCKYEKSKENVVKLIDAIEGDERMR